MKFLLCVALFLAFCHVSVCKETLLRRRRDTVGNGFSMGSRLTPLQVLENMSPFGAQRIEKLRPAQAAPAAAAPSSAKKVVIVGSGPVGLYTAIKMASSPLSAKVTLCEKYPTPSRARFIGLFQTEVDFLKQNMPDTVTVEEGTFFPDGKKEKRGILVADLEEALRTKAKALGVQFEDGVKAVGFEDTGTAEAKTFKLKINNLDENQPRSLDFDYLVYAAGSRRSEGVSSFASHFQNHEILQNPNKAISMRDLAREYKEAFETAGNEFNPQCLKDLLREPLAVKPDSKDRESIQDTTSWALDNVDKLFDSFKTMIMTTDASKPIHANELSCFVASLNPNYFDSYRSNTELRGKRASAIESELLDWIFLDLKKTETDPVSRIHFEGPLPSFFGVLRTKIAAGLNNKREEGKDRVLVVDDWRNKVIVDFAILEFLVEIINQHPDNTSPKLVLNRNAYLQENPFLKGLFLTEGQRPVSMFDLEFTASQHVMSNFVNSNQRLFVVGDALTEPWYRFGLGVHDGWFVVDEIINCLKAENADCLKFAGIETMRRKRSIQILFSAFASYRYFAPKPESTGGELHPVLTRWQKVVTALFKSYKIPEYEQDVTSAAKKDEDYQSFVAMRICEALVFRSAWMQHYTTVSEEDRIAKSEKMASESEKLAANVFTEDHARSFFNGMIPSAFCTGISADLPFFDPQGVRLSQTPQTKTPDTNEASQTKDREGLPDVLRDNYVGGKSASGSGTSGQQTGDEPVVAVDDETPVKAFDEADDKPHPNILPHRQ